jgi:hypothetical protein
MAMAVSKQRPCVRARIESKKTGLVFGRSRNGSFIELFWVPARRDDFRFSADYQQIVTFKKCACPNCLKSSVKPPPRTAKKAELLPDVQGACT